MSGGLGVGSCADRLDAKLVSVRATVVVSLMEKGDMLVIGEGRRVAIDGKMAPGVTGRDSRGPRTEYCPSLGSVDTPHLTDFHANHI